MHTDDRPVRDSRAGATLFALDLSRPNDAIHAVLRRNWPNVVGLWWELDEGDKTGWAYGGDGRILARLVHAP